MADPNRQEAEAARQKAEAARHIRYAVYDDEYGPSPPTNHSAYPAHLDDLDDHDPSNLNSRRPNMHLTDQLKKIIDSNEELLKMQLSLDRHIITGFFFTMAMLFALFVRLSV